MTTAAEYAALAETSANTAATAAVDVQNKVAIAESSANLSTTNSNTVAASIAGAASANTTAALQAVAAQNYRDLAQLWANADPNVIVEGTAFSARHQALSTIATLAAMQVNLDTHTDLYTANKVTTDAALAYLAYRLDTGDLVFDSSTIDTTITNLNNTLSAAINNRLATALYNSDTLNLANFAKSNQVSTDNKIIDYLDSAGQIALQGMLSGASNTTKISYAGVVVDASTGTITNAAGSAVATEYGVRVAAVEETIGTEYIAGTGSISAKYTVKVDAGGRVAGFGLLSTANTDLSGTGFSEFVVAADSFKVGAVGSNVSPFRIITGAGVCVSALGVETGNVAQGACTGTWIPPGTYMNAAMIADATINVAKIANLTVTTAQVTGNLEANRITTSTGNDRIEITNTAIKVYNGGSLRVKIGDLS
jgi:hypothetical protein